MHRKVRLSEALISRTQIEPRMQIDYVIYDIRHASNILDVKSMRNANIYSEHNFVRASFDCKNRNGEVPLQSKSKVNRATRRTTRAQVAIASPQDF